MLLYDRFSGRNIESKDLPNHIDLGRFFMLDSNNAALDITPDNIELSNNQTFIANILGNENEDNDELCSILREIGHSIEINLTSTYPIIQNPAKDVDPKPFEIDLDNALSHFEHIFQEPHALLDRTTEKVNVAKVKRIPPKGYQHLASHTEDWLHRSFTTLLPGKVIHEELVLSYNVYENQVLCSFVKRALKKVKSHLHNAKLKETFLEKCDAIFNNTVKNKGWREKNNRNWTLIGKVYKQNSENDAIRKQNLELIELLNRISSVLSKIRYTQMYDEVDMRFVESVKWHDTNVLTDHKHYKYIKPLWNSLESEDSLNTKEKRDSDNRKTMSGLRSYVESLFVYVLSHSIATDDYSRSVNIPSYQLIGCSGKWEATHPFLPKVLFSRDKSGVMSIKVGNCNTKKVIALGNIPHIDKKYQEYLDSYNNLLLVAYDIDNNNNIISNNLISVNSMDVDSVERIGKFLRCEMIKDFLMSMSRKITFDGAIKDYVKYIKDSYLDIDKNCLYIINYPTSTYFKSASEYLINDETYKKLKKNRQDEIRKSFNNLLSSLENEINDFKNKYCICPYCGKPLNRHSFSSKNYIYCTSCGASLILNQGYYEFKVTDTIDELNLLGLDSVRFCLDNNILE